MKNILIAMLVALPLIFSASVNAALPWDDIVDGTCGDSQPGFDLEPALGSAIFAALSGGTGEALMAAGGAWLGDEIDTEVEGDAIDLGTMGGGAIGAVLGGPLGAFVGAAIGDWITDEYGCL